MFLRAFGSSIITHIHPTEAAVEASSAMAAKPIDNSFFIVSSL
jgi:hypothetical protein